MDDIVMVRQVTANVWFWQGLRWAPGGLVFLLIALTALFPPGWALLQWLCWSGAIALWWYLYHAADRYYARRFGVVVGRPGQHRRRERVKWLLVYPAMTAAIFIDILLAPRVFLSGVVWAGALLAYRASTGGGRSHYFAGAALLATLTLLPLTGAVAAGRPMVVVWAATVGVLYLVLGFLDHLELVRRFPVHDES